jgi:tetratricopeptide (TPR) repeat protein
MYCKVTHIAIPNDFIYNSYTLRDIMKSNQFSRIKWERARDLKKRGAFQEAEEELKEALEEEPDNPILKASLAELYLRQDRLVEANILAEAILSSDSQNPQALYVLGELFSKEDKLEEALQCFHQAQKKNAGTFLTLRIAQTFRDMGRLRESLETLDSVLVRESENLRFLKEKALILSRMKRWDEALMVYEKTQKVNPDDSFVRKEVYRLRGLKRPDQKTIRELETVVKLPSRKDDAQLHGFLGQKLKDAGKLKEALKEFQTATRLAPENPYFLRQEGFCHYHLGDYPEAIQALSQAFRKDPKDYILRSTLKKMYAATGNIGGFIALLEEILKDHPHNVKLIGVLRRVKKEADAEEPNAT